MRADETAFCSSPDNAMGIEFFLVIFFSGTLFVASLLSTFKVSGVDFAPALILEASPIELACGGISFMGAGPCAGGDGAGDSRKLISSPALIIGGEESCFWIGSGAGES